MGIGALLLVGYLGWTSQFGAVRSMTGTQWTWVAISALLLTAFVLTWYAGLKRTDLGVATSVLVLGFPVTWALGIFARGTPFTALETAGAVSVTAGVVLAVGWRHWNDLLLALRWPTPRPVTT
jgi:drug/metabolite transporter (DMT)-like permease